jgi:hypothetical protein
MTNPNTIDLTQESYYLEFYMCILIANFGFITNILNILVCLRKEIRKMPMGFYNINISLNNIMILIVSCYLYFFSQSIGKKEIINMSMYTCLFLPFFSKLFVTISLFLDMMLTFDRLVCFSVNYRTHFINNRKKCTQIVVVMYVIGSAINTTCFTGYLENQSKLDSTTNQTVDNFICSYSDLIEFIQDSIFSLISIIAPLIIQIVMSCMIIYKLYKMTNQPNVHTLDQKKEKRFAFTVVVLNILSIIGHIPLPISVVIASIYGYDSSLISTTSNESAIASFAFICSIAFGIFFKFTLLFFVNTRVAKYSDASCSVM